MGVNVTRRSFASAFSAYRVFHVRPGINVIALYSFCSGLGLYLITMVDFGQPVPVVSNALDL